MSNANLNPNMTGLLCGDCKQQESDEEKVVFCDYCQNWYHLACQNVAAAMKLDETWACKTCKFSTLSTEEIEQEVAKLLAEKDRQAADFAKWMKLVKEWHQLEKEKKAQLWEYEKGILELKLSTEEELNREREAERENLQKRVDKLVAERENSAAELQRLTETFKKISAESVKRKTKKKRKRASRKDTSSECSLSESTEPEEMLPSKAQLSARQVFSSGLPEFTGKPEEWPAFISSYELSTKACGYSNLDNLARLQDCIKEPARTIVNGSLLQPQFVPQVIETLRMFYGRPEQLLNSLLVKIKRVESPKINKLETFISFGVAVRQLCDHIEASNLRDHLVNPMLIQELVDKLPATTKLEWVRFKRSHEEVTLRTLADFLSEIMKTASEVVCYADCTEKAQRTIVTGSGKNKTNFSHQGFIHLHDDVDTLSEQSQKRIRSPCQMCERTDHRIRNCNEFRKLSINERLKLVDELDLCHLCLNSHGNSRCKLDIRCTVKNCGQDHNTLLHVNQAVLNLHKVQKLSKGNFSYEQKLNSCQDDMRKLSERFSRLHQEYIEMSSGEDD